MAIGWVDCPRCGGIETVGITSTMPVCVATGCDTIWLSKKDLSAETLKITRDAASKYIEEVLLQDVEDLVEVVKKQERVQILRDLKWITQDSSMVSAKEIIGYLEDRIAASE